KIFGEFKYLSALEPVFIHIAHPVGVGQKIDRLSVGGELRVQIIGSWEEVKNFHVARIHVHHSQLVASELKRLQIGVETAIGGKYDFAAVCGPARLDLGITVVG